MIEENQKPKYAIGGPFTASNFLNAASAGALGVDTNGITILTAHATAGSRVTSLVASSDDTAAVNAFIYIRTSGGAIKPLGIVNIPLSSGNSGTVASVDCLLGSGVTLVGMPVDNTGKRFIHLGPGEELKASCLANMTAARKCHFTAQYENYNV